MLPFVSAYEKALIQRDYNQMVSGEGSTAVLVWRTPVAPILQPEPDPVYKFDRRDQKGAEETLQAKCLIHIVGSKDLRILSFGILKEGDAVFYFLNTLNLKEPKKGKPVIQDSLYITDPHANKWSPVITSGALKDYLAMTLNNKSIAEVVPCVLMK